MASMANVKKGQSVPPGKWWKHLRAWKRWFWKSERQAAAAAARAAARESRRQ